MSRHQVSGPPLRQGRRSAVRAPRAAAVVALVLVVATPVSLRATPAGGHATTLVPKSDMQVTVTASAGFATGFTGPYTITAVNNGPQSAPAPITITDTLPAGLTYNSVTAPGGWTCTNTVQVVSCTLPGALAKNVTQTFTIVANITASAAASVTNIVTASDVANDDTNLANNRATVTSAVTVRTVTSVPTVVAESRLPSNGTNYTDTYVVQNTGNVVDSYTLAASVAPAAGVVTIISVNGVNGTTGTITNLAVNGTSTVTVAYSVPIGASTGATAVLKLTATSTFTASSTGAGDVTVTVVRAGISMSKQLYRDDQTTLVVGGVAPGEYVQYKVTVTNTGSAAASAVSISDPVPSAVTHIANTPDAVGWTMTVPPAGTITASLAGTLAAASSRYFWIRVRVK
ncbi:MAG: hypothetical protein ACJ8AD_17850 [Gemmatimonadaceae bacterium]